MKSSASGSQRIGQPMCVQFTENAVNSSALSRRSHAAPFAVIPAHGSGDGSGNGTLTVLPISKLLVLPTEIQSLGVLRKSGAMTKPTSGTPSSAAHNPLRPMQSFAKNPRRLSSSGVGGRHDCGWLFSFIAFLENFADP